MIRSYGHEYTVKLSVDAEIVVTAFNADEAADKAVEDVETELERICRMAEAEAISVERGDEALEPIEEDK